MTRLAKHSSQKFDINTRNTHKGIFSCGLLVYVTLPQRHTDLQQFGFGVFFLYPLFVYSCPTSLVKNMVFLAS